MRYLAAIDRGAVEVRSAPAEPMRPAAVRVRVAFVGVCHSDIGGVAEAQGPFPYRMGHEVSGTVVESEEDDLPSGTRVVAHVEDGYATEVVADRSRIVPLDPGCELLDAALAEPVACVIGALGMLDLAGLDRVVIVGAGFMGLLTLGHLAALGHRVTVVEPRAKARALALQLGAESVLEPDEVDVVRVANPLVIEATGGQSGLALAGDLVTTAGMLGILGYHQSEQGLRTVDMRGWNFRCLKVLNLQHRDRHDFRRWIDRAQRMSARRVLNPGALVDDFVDMEELPAAFGHDPSRRDLIKSVLRGPDTPPAGPP